MKRILLLFGILLLSFGIYSQNVLQVSLNHQNNDVEVRNNNTVNFTSSGLDLHGKDGSTPVETFIRFEGITLPEDAVINNVYLLVHGRTAGSGTSRISVKGEIGSSATYPTSTSASTGNNIRSRSYTDSSVIWNTSGCVVNRAYYSPDLKDLIMEMLPDGLNNSNLAFRLTGDEQGSFIVHSFSNQNYAPKLVIDYWSMYGSSVTEVATGYDDGRETTSGAMALVSAYIQLGGRNDVKNNGIRFANVLIPDNAEITEAYIEFYSYATSPQGCMDIYAELGNAQSYTTSSRSITSRTYTSNKVSWFTDAFKTNNQLHRTPDLKNIIDENRINGNWSSGNALAFNFVGLSLNDGASVRSFEGGSQYRPRLVVKYKNNNTGPYISDNDAGIYKAIVSKNTDDGRQDNNGSMYLGDAYLRLGGRSDGKYHTVRFDKVEIPAGAQIRNAYIEFYTYSTSAPAVMKIFTELGNPSTYSTSSNNISSRNYSSNKIDWFTTAWSSDYQYQKTPDLKNIIDENRIAGWQSGQGMAFLFEGLSLNNGAMVRSYEGGNNYRPRLVIEYENNGNGPSVVIPEEATSIAIVSMGADDARQNNNGSVSLGDAYLRLGGRTDGKYHAIRFTGINIPEDAEIEDAYIEFYAYSTSAPASMNIYTELGNPVSYNTSNNNLLSRNYTNNKIHWYTEIWGTNYQYHRTPDLKNIIDENRLNGGWRSGQNLAFLFEGLTLNNGACAHAFEGNINNRPRLVIKYKNNGNGPSVDIPLENTYVSIVSANNNDAYEHTNGTINLGDPRLQLGGRGDVKHTAVKFSNVEIPEDAEVVNAYIQFYAYASSNPAQVNIYTETGNAATYTTARNNITSRRYSVNKINWQTDALRDYNFLYTPDLRNIINEARLSGWTTGQDLAFMFEGLQQNSGAAVRSYEGGVNYRPRLVIEYINNGNGPVIYDAETDPARMDGLFINELCSQGSAEQKEDWIELYNSHPYDLHIIGGVYLSDKNKTRDLFEIKNVFIPANGFAIFIADDKTDEGRNHLNFGLSSSGETVYLSRRVEDEIIQQDAVTFGMVPYLHSYGRTTDGAGEWVEFINPTYNASNTRGSQLLNINFSQERGVYPEGFSLTLSSDSDVTIRYTTDGKYPSTTTGNIYNGPINVNQTSVIKAIAYNSSGRSDIIAHTYVLQNNYVNETRRGIEWQFKSSITSAEYAVAIAELPIVSISTDTELTSLWKQASVEYIDRHVYPDHENFYSNSMTRKFGQESVAMLNSGIKFKFNKDAGVKRAEYPFFDSYPDDSYPTTKKMHTLELKEGQDGPSRNVFGLGFMRFSEKVSMNLQKEMGKYALDTRYVNIFVNGKYRGLKTMRNDFKQQNFEEMFGDDSDNYTKVVMQDGGFATGLVEAGEGNPAIWTEIKSLANSKNLQGFKQKVDLEDMIKFQIMFMFVDSENEADMIVHNNAPQYTRARFNINDLDGAFYGASTSATTTNTNMNSTALAGGGGNYKYKWNTAVCRRGPGRLFEQFMGANNNPYAGNLEFKTLVKDYVLESFGPVSENGSNPEYPLSIINVQNKIHEAVAELDRVYKLDAAYMAFGSNVYHLWKNIQYPRIIAQVPERVTYSIAKWLEYGMAHTLNPVEINSSDNIELVTTIYNPNSGTDVYYTLDGSDPMGNNGGKSDNAFLYNVNTGLALSTGTYEITARAFTTNNWGPKTTERITVRSENAGELVISGINYNPLPNYVKEAEFIMLTNNGTVTLDISGYQIEDAVKYTFAEGVVVEPYETVMLAKDISLIEGYDDMRKFQWNSGSLSNDGEPVTFTTPEGIEADHVYYRSSYPWPPQAAGQGYFLRLKDLDSDNTIAENWEAVYIGESPVMPVYPLVISGINYNPLPNYSNEAEFILLTNNSNTQLDISGYYINDAFKYEFPQNTVMESYETIMIAKDPDLIQGYQELRKFRWNSGSLSNSGEPVTFMTPGDLVADHVEYSSSAPWPTEAAGQGYYLMLKDVALDNALPQSWEAVLIENDAVVVDNDQKANGVAEEEQLLLTVYPNPVSTTLHLTMESTDGDEFEINIHSSNGRLVMNRTINTVETSIGVSSWGAGMYIITVRDKNTGNVKNIRFIKN